MTDKIEIAKRHLAKCMEEEDWPLHDCACNCDDVAYLLTEVEQMRVVCAEWLPIVERQLASLPAEALESRAYQAAAERVERLRAASQT